MIYHNFTSTIIISESLKQNTKRNNFISIIIFFESFFTIKKDVKFINNYKTILIKCLNAQLLVVGLKAINLKTMSYAFRIN